MHLVDSLAKRFKCSLISDLRAVAEACSMDMYLIIEAILPEQLPAWEWNNTYSYITRVAMTEYDAKDARENLLHFLWGNMSPEERARYAAIKQQSSGADEGMT